MQNSRNELGLFAVLFFNYCAAIEKNSYMHLLSVLRQTVVRRFFCAKKERRKFNHD